MQLVSLFLHWGLGGSWDYEATRRSGLAAGPTLLHQTGPALGTACPGSTISVVPGFLGGYIPVCLTPLLSRTPARRREGSREGTLVPNLITATLTKFDTGVWGPKACMLCAPIATFLVPEASRPHILCTFHTLCLSGNMQTQQGHGGCTSLHVHRPSCSSTGTVNMVFIGMRLGPSPHSEPGCC